MNISKVAIVTTVHDFSLYNKVVKSFPSEFTKIAIDGRSGLYGIESLFFIFKKLKSSDLQWLVLIDEDVLFIHPDKVMEVIQQMDQGGHAACGVRDGGVVSHRNHNPHAINPFFCVLNWTKIREKYDERQIKFHQYIKKNEFDESHLHLPFDFDPLSLFEPYYCFFFWMRRNGFSFQFLDAKMHPDEISNYILLDGEPFAIHTWYARVYGTSKNQTERINQLIHKTLDLNKKTPPYKVYKKPIYTWRLLKRKLKKFLLLR